MRFVYLGSRSTLHASSPRSVTLTQLRFTCLAVASSAGDLHPEDRAHAGRTNENSHPGVAASTILAEWTGLEPATPGVTGRYSNQLNYHSMWRLVPCIAADRKQRCKRVALAV